MKFRTPAFLLLALLSAGCSQSGSDTPDELGAPIEFAAPIVVGAAEASRAQMLDALPEGEVFGVLGYCVPVTTLTEGEGDDAVSSHRRHTQPEPRLGLTKKHLSWLTSCTRSL